MFSQINRKPNIHMFKIYSNSHVHDIQQFLQCIQTFKVVLYILRKCYLKRIITRPSVWGSLRSHVGDSHTQSFNFDPWVWQQAREPLPDNGLKYIYGLTYCCDINNYNMYSVASSLGWPLNRGSSDLGARAASVKHTY